MSDTKLLSLSEIFNNKIFRIPDFQRGYSWEERQLEDFWEDIQNLSPNKIHYIGLLTVEPIKESDIVNIEKWKDDLWLFKKGLSAYYVIDGQQRLTTLIILLHEILRTFSDDEGINYGQKSEWIDRFCIVPIIRYINHLYLDMKRTIQAMSTLRQNIRTRISYSRQIPRNIVYRKPYVCKKVFCQKA